MLHVYESVFVSVACLDCLSVYIHDFKFIEGVPHASGRELHGHVSTVHHSYAFSTTMEG